jgi:hypothetical protein
MAGRNLTLTALRALDTRLQHLAGFVHRRVEQFEKWAEPVSSPAFEPPDPDPSQPPPGEPPAHWLERVRRAVPGYLDPAPATSAEESARPFEFKAGVASEEITNPPALSNPVGVESPVEAKPVSSENKEPAEPAPKFSFRAARRANQSEKAPSDPKKGSEASRGTESEAGSPETRSMPPNFQRARLFFPGYGPERETGNTQPPQYTGSPAGSAVAASFGEVSYSATSQFGEDTLNQSQAGNKSAPGDSNLAGYSSGSPPEEFNSPQYGVAADSRSTGPALPNKPAPNYSGDRKSPASQPGNSPFQTNSNPVRDYRPSRQGHNLKFGILAVNKSQNPPVANTSGELKKSISRSQPKKGAVSNEPKLTATENWSDGQEKENFPNQKNQHIKISPFQSGVDLNNAAEVYRPWPELPEETPVENEADNWQQVRRKMEHLRRLDEEQRGTYGASSLFN